MPKDGKTQAQDALAAAGMGDLAKFVPEGLEVSTETRGPAGAQPKPAEKPEPEPKPKKEDDPKPDVTPDLGVSPEVLKEYGIELPTDPATETPSPPAGGEGRENDRIRELAEEARYQRELNAKLLDRLLSGEKPEGEPKSAPAPQRTEIDLSKVSLRKPEGVSDEDWNADLEVVQPILQQMLPQVAAQMGAPVEGLAQENQALREQMSQLTAMMADPVMEKRVGPEWNDKRIRATMGVLYERAGRPKELDNDYGAFLLFQAAKSITGAAGKSARVEGETAALMRARTQTEAGSGGPTQPPDEPKEVDYGKMPQKEFDDLFQRAVRGQIPTQPRRPGR